MKAITLLVIRNSRLEDLHASGPVAAGGITGITTLGLSPLSQLIAARRQRPLAAGPADDPFAGTVRPAALAALPAVRARPDASPTSGVDEAGVAQDAA